MQKGEEGLQGPCLRSRVISFTEELGRGTALPRSDLCMSVLSCRLALEEGLEAAGGTGTVPWKCSWQWEGMDEPLALHPALGHQPFHTLLCSPMLSPASPSAQPEEQQAVEEDAGGAEGVSSQSEAGLESYQTLLRGEETETFPKSDPLQKWLDRLLTIASLRSHPGWSAAYSCTSAPHPLLQTQGDAPAGPVPSSVPVLNLSLLLPNCPQDHFASYLLLFPDLHPLSPSLRQCQVESISQSSVSSVPEAGSARYTNHRNKD